MEIRDAVPGDRTALEELTADRCPHTEPWMVGWVLTGDHTDFAAVACEGDQVLGYTYAMRIPGVPLHRRSTYVLVAAPAEGNGVGRALDEHLRARLAGDVTEITTRVFDDDDRGLAVARHWGFETVQVSITSRLALADVEPATPPVDVTLEPGDDLRFADQDAVEAMFAASQTNPEATNSHLMTLDSVRQFAAEGERPIVTLARVGGVPAALCYALTEEAGEDGGVVYTGVDPRFRGRGLGRLVKQDVHHRAYLAGVRRLGTDNEEHNAGIRRINAEMGYVEEYGVHRMRRLLRPAAPAPA